MKPLFKAYFEWREPKEYLRLKDKQELPETLRMLVIPFLFAFAMLMLTWWLKKEHHQRSYPLGHFVGIALCGSAVVTYGVAWITMKCPSYIRIRDGAIFKTRGRGTVLMEFKKLDNFRWIPTSKWWVLRLVRKSGRHTSIAVPLDMPREEITSFLEQRGLGREPDGHCTDFEDLAFLRNLP